MFSFLIKHYAMKTLGEWLCLCVYMCIYTQKKQTNSVAYSPQANYTDWTTAIFWRNLLPNFADGGMSRGQRSNSPTVVNISFLDRSR
jgi:hypothetical protein